MGLFRQSGGEPGDLGSQISLMTGSGCYSGPLFLHLENESLIGMMATGISGLGPRQGMTQLASRWTSVSWPGQSGNDAQLWMCLVKKVKSDAVKNNIAQEPGMLSP